MKVFNVFYYERRFFVRLALLLLLLLLLLVVVVVLLSLSSLILLTLCLSQFSWFSGNFTRELVAPSNLRSLGLALQLL